MKDIKAILLGIILLLAICWILVANNFAIYKTFAPAQEQARREVFEQTKSYRQGMIQEFQNMQFAYIQADKEHKTALASLIKHRAADIPSDALPSDLNKFIESLK